jgi:hypothetical protein
MNVGHEEIPPVEGQAGVLDPLAVWREELARHHPKSHEYQELALALADLAAEVGIGPAAAEPGLESEAELPPPAFSLVSHPAPLEVPGAQFRDAVPLLHRQSAYLLSVAELTTDGGRRVRLVDLRPELASHTHDITPQGAEVGRLDSRFYHDLRFYVDKGWSRNVVHGLGGIANACYTRIVGSKARAYWRPVRVWEHGAEHVLTVARIADCGGDQRNEIALYRRLFGVTLRHVD